MNRYGQARRIAIFCIWLVVIIAGDTLVGWWGNVAWLRFSLPGFPALRPNTALGMLLGAVAIVSLWPEQISAHRRQLARGLAGIVVAISLLTLVQHAAGLDLGIDRLLAGAASEAGPGHLIRPSVLAAVGLALLSAGLLLLSHPHVQTRARHQ